MPISIKQLTRNSPEVQIKKGRASVQMPALHCISTEKRLTQRQRVGDDARGDEDKELPALRALDVRFEQMP